METVPEKRKHSPIFIVGEREAEKNKEENEGDRSVFIFEHFRDGMKSEEIRRTAGFHTHSGAPPPDVRTGCDIAISLPSDEVPAAEKLLRENGINLMDVIFKFAGGLPELQLSRLIKKVEYGDYTMVRVGNMKLTFHKATGIISNISGGGCPDIPLLSLKMVGKRLDEVTTPAQIGFTLCAYTLQKAYEIALKSWNAR
ncbi:MAG: DUF3343 domain-containing protein [Thaumarchaeota archaeon]|nr:DUF3343 domain-containing protein [Nitrososphaerota archaeon]